MSQLSRFLLGARPAFPAILLCAMAHLLAAAPARLLADAESLLARQVTEAGISEAGISEKGSSEAGESSSPPNPTIRNLADEEFQHGLRIADLQIGLGGAWKVGHWTPVRVTLQSGGEPVRGRLQLIAPDGDGFIVRYASHPDGTPFVVPAESSLTLTSYVKFGRPRAELEIRVTAEDEAASPDADVSERTILQRVAAHELATPLVATRPWVLQVGSTVNLDRVTRRRRSQLADDLFTSVTLDGSVLPSDWFAYEGVQTVLLLTSELGQIEAIDVGQREALEQWVRMGGQLIISSGKNGPAIQAEEGPLARLIPGKIVATAEQPVAPGLESFALAGQQPLAPFIGSVLTEPRGRIEAYIEGRLQARQPAIVRMPRGFGHVVFLAFDVDQSPFSDWPATDELFRNILRSYSPARDAVGREEGSRRVTHFGYDELAGQLRSALDHFPTTDSKQGVQLVSFFAVAAVLACYVLCISVGDHFFLQRIVGRMAWTWLTFPLLVIAFSVGIVLLGQSWRGGTSLRVNQVDVVDLDLVDGTVRGTSWFHLYSPATRGHDLSLEPVQPGNRVAESDLPFHATFSWQGLPGQGLGGMDQSAGESSFPVTYTTRNDAPATPEMLLFGMPVTSGSTKSLMARWWSFEPLMSVERLSSDRDGFLNGTIVNPLDIELEDALLAYDRWAYRIDRPLRAGEQLRIDSLQRRDLEWRLTRRRALQGKTTYSSTPWETDSRDVDRIVEIMMFHEAAGGRGYTDLNHQYQQFTDLSEHLHLGRAVLVGRVARPGLQLKVGDEVLTAQADRQWTWYRLIFPVEFSAKLATESFRP